MWTRGAVGAPVDGAEACQQSDDKQAGRKGGSQTGRKARSQQRWVAWVGDGTGYDGK